MDIILFKSDWERFPTAIVDYNTGNQSFLQFAAKLKNEGIDNCEFMLALLQPELSGLDPFADDLTEEQMFKIGIEAKYNPWYYFREIARVPATSGGGGRPLQANRGNIALYWSFFNHIDFGLLQPRQTGKSVSTDVLNNGITNIWGEGTNTYLITKDHALRGANIERLKKIRSFLPSYIYYPSRADGDNNEIIYNDRLGNRFKTAVGRNDKVAADKLGRGLTVPILHFDELAYISLIEISLPVALGSGSAAKDEAAELGGMYGNIYTTTAGSLNNRDGKYAHALLTNGSPWTDRFYDCRNQAELALLVEKQSGGKPLIYGAFNHRQLGKTDEWLRKKLIDVNAFGDIADRDWMNVWTTGSMGSPLTLEEKRRVNGSVIEPKHIEISEDSYILRWFIEEHEIKDFMKHNRCVLAIDPSETLGQENDNTGFLVIDIRTHKVIASGRYNETNVNVLSKFICNFLVTYKNVTFIPERKSTGTTIIGHLFIQLPRHGEDPFRRIFNRIIDEKESFEHEYRTVMTTPVSARSTQFYDRYMRHFGYNTSGSGRHARDNLYGEALKSSMRIGAHCVLDRELANELSSLTVANGRVDHMSGNHDDLVICWLLVHWFCTKARNLSYYGIDARQIFTAAKAFNVEETPEAMYRDELNRNIMDEFNTLMTQLGDEEDPMITMQLESRIRKLSTRIDVSEQGGEGIDSMIEQAKEERERKRRIEQTHRPERPSFNRGRPHMPRFYSRHMGHNSYTV